MIDGASPAGIKFAFDSLQNLLKIRDWTMNADAKLAVANALNGLADAKVEVANLKLDNDELKAELAKLKRQKSEIDGLKRVGELFLDEAANLFKCPTCVEKDVIALTLANQNHQSPRLKCNVCQSEFKNPTYVLQKPPKVITSRNRRSFE